MSPRRKSLQQEHGQTLTEHAGIGLVVVVLLLVVAGGITVASGDGIGQAIVCKIAQQIRSVAGGSYECPSSSNMPRIPLRFPRRSRRPLSRRPRA
mgnify:CR=1 FL=1